MDHWVIVPSTPTTEMKRAANKAVCVNTPDGTWAIALDEAECAYAAMIAAAPSPAQREWMSCKMLQALKMARDAFTGLSNELPHVSAVRAAIVLAEKDHNPSEAFYAWLNEGPKLAKAAGCHVGIKVTEAKP